VRSAPCIRSRTDAAMTRTHFVPQALEVAPQPVEMDERLDGHLRVLIEDDGGDFDIETPPDPWSRDHPQSGAHTEVPKLTRREAKRRYRASKAAQRQLEAERTASRQRMLGGSVLPTDPPAATPEAETALAPRVAPSPPADALDHEPPPAPPQPTPTATLTAPNPPTDTHDHEPPPAPPQPTPAVPPRTRQIGKAGKAVAFLALLAVTSMLWYFSLGTLVVSRGTALVSGWEVTSILTGSMSPALNVGDLVAFEPVDAADLELGQIIVFDDPTRPGVTYVHRLTAINDDGTYTTKGDANEKDDSTPVSQANVQGVVRMVSPYGGYPTMLLSHGKYLQLVVLIGLLLSSALIVHGPEPHFMRRHRGQIPEPSAESDAELSE